jgi:hypothetical protein
VGEFEVAIGVWRCTKNRLLPRVQELPDGSYLSTIMPTGVGRAQAKEQAIVVRVIEYTMQGLPDAQPSYRLLTSMLDHHEAPALELAALYHERWQVEEVFDELKTHLLRSRRVLRSKRPELVRQEFYGWVLAHYAVRWLLHEGATRHHMPHDKLSFASHIQLLRREQPQSGAFPPRAPQTAKVDVGQSDARKRPTQIKADEKQTKSANGEAAKLRVQAARPRGKAARTP